ncbi:CYTH and CHAD domain-containing protein [Plantactinospora sp. S1510]|uniref:CYTH and CHAD domain-containing protein n=1 Tax=Plantactinospora alkalitolerans TaxID=2789879 RepID=A0ABS0H707_9ACTN|nr:CYTH and CHAD domain-containing protein [Plantactinospora alkalitolerans]MBF9134253.1 CYTH and CHAD domain-containing protein [Plantactinospora alkalitolerans]
MLEEERKYEVDQEFLLPELSGAVPAGGRLLELPPVTLTATYLDTADLRLARAGVSLRHRRGDALPWTVKLPADSPGVRHEISRQGRPKTPPADLVALVTAYSRGAELTPAAVVRTVRRAYELRDDADRVLVELADDAVSVLDGKRVRATFREIEVERKRGERELLDRVESVLTGAGARAGGFTPKHVRALGAAAEGEPDLVAPGELAAEPSAGDVVVAAIRRSTGRLLGHDPLVRLRAPVGNDDTAVHQMRVGCRRLRSDLRTFGPLVRKAWARPLRDELKWLAGILGQARDAEVLRARLSLTAAADPLSPLDPAAVARIDRVLVARHEAALAAVDEALGSARYLTLVEALVDAARTPQLTGRAGRPATEVLPRLVARPWHRLTDGDDEVDGAADLDPEAPDERWHAVRINGKRARYAVDAVAGVLGGEAAKLARALKKVQDLLGEHQDAAVAAQTWLSIAELERGDHATAVTAGRLFERERASVHAARAAFPDAWGRTARRRRTAWLR